MSTRDGLDLDGSSAYLTRTNSGAASLGTKSTIALWFEADDLTDSPPLIFGIDGSPAGIVVDVTDGTLQVAFIIDGNNGSVQKESVISTDTKYFLMVIVDTTQATAADRLRVWLGEYEGTISEITSWDNDDRAGITQNEANGIFGNSGTIRVGTDLIGTTYFNGTIADVYALDGQAITDPATFQSGGKPIAASVTFGNNGFHLDFANSGDLGADASGNDNDFTIPTVDTPSQINTSGLTPFGDMTAGGGLAAAFDGNTNQAAAACAESPTAFNGYVGVTLASSTAINGAVAYGSNNEGYVVGANPVSQSVQLYAKAGGVPSNGTDGSNLGNTGSFTDTGNESGTPRAIDSADKETLYDQVWVRYAGTTSTVKAIAEAIFNANVVTPVIDSGDWVEDYLELAAGANAVSGSVAAAAAALDGVGSVAVAAEGDLGAGASTLAGAGEISIAADGDLPTGAAVIDGEASGLIDTDGALAAGGAVIDGEASTGAFPVTGDLAASDAAIDGDVAATVDGDGDLAAGAASVSGHAEAIVAADGALTAGVAAIDGDGAAIVDADGGLAASAAAVDASIAVGPSATGGLVAGVAVVDGNATIIVAVDVALQVDPAALDAAGSLGLSVLADPAAGAAEIAGEGSVSIAGDGALTATSAALSTDLSVLAQASGSLIADDVAIAGDASPLIASSIALPASPAQVSGAAAAQISINDTIAAAAAELSGLSLVQGGAIAALAGQPAVVAGDGSVLADLSGAIATGQAVIEGLAGADVAAEGDLTASPAVIGAAFVIGPPRRRIVNAIFY